nr:MAG TPA_asm: portal [Caudoviricetes sp.]
MATNELDEQLAAEAASMYEKAPATQGEMLEDSVLNRFKKQEKAKKLVAWVKSEYEKCKSARKLEENDWYLQLAFYNGYQYHDWRTVAGKQGLAEEPNPSNLPRITVNRIEPIIRTEIAKTTAQQPSASVVPASNDEDDLLSATAGEQVWQAIYNDNNFQTEILQKAEFWRATTGNGFIKCFWDPTVKHYETRKMEDPMTGEKRIERVVNARGDVKFEAISPFHLYVPDLSQEDLQKQPYVLNVYTKSEAWIKQNFSNVLPKDFKPSKVSSSEIMDASLMDLRGNDNAKPEAVLVIEMWVKPGNVSWMPKGGLVTIIDTEIVQYAEDGVPYHHGEYPFAHLSGIPNGKFYRRSVIKNLIPLQRELNRTRSQIIHAKNLMAKPQMMFSEGSVDPRKIQAKAGIWIPVRPGFPMPTPVPIQPLPSYVLQEVQQLQTDFEDISGQHQISRGESGSLTAATAIAYLGERDDAYLTTVFNSIEAGIEKMARQALSLFVQYVEEARLIKITGADGSFDAMMLSGADIASGTDIRVESGSALPTSKAARQALVTDWMKMGFIPPEDGLRVLEMGMLKQYYNTIKIDENAAQRENLMMKKITEEMMMQIESAWNEGAARGDQDKVEPDTGKPLMVPPAVPVNAWDNHAVHIEIHNRFRKSQAFQILPDVVKAEFQKHISLHQQALMLQQQQQAMAGQPEQPQISQAPEGAEELPEQTGMTDEQLG